MPSERDKYVYDHQVRWSAFCGRKYGVHPYLNLYKPKLIHTTMEKLDLPEIQLDA